MLDRRDGRRRAADQVNRQANSAMIDCADRVACKVTAYVALSVLDSGHVLSSGVLRRRHIADNFRDFDEVPEVAGWTRAESLPLSPTSSNA